MEELNALRIQEEVEREFRNKERAAMRKKKETDAALKKARQEQVSIQHKCKCYWSLSISSPFSDKTH
jgi:hypothetical protein